MNDKFLQKRDNIISSPLKSQNKLYTKKEEINFTKKLNGANTRPKSVDFAHNFNINDKNIKH